VFGDDWKGLFEAVTGFGLGGSSIALFGRVGGGIYTKVCITQLAFVVPLAPC
jgi:Na+/H+-translocating membrane pyrophosphatase